MKFLIVEDNTIAGTILRNLFEHKGHIVHEAVSAMVALDYITEETYDVYIIDIVLPGMYGTELLKHLRKLGDITPAIAATARSSSEDIIEYFQVGFEEVETKPINFESLIAKVEKVTNCTV